MATVDGKAKSRSPQSYSMRRPTWMKALKRPEVGALGGAILVYAFFFVLAPPFREALSLATILYQAATIGIPAVAVAMLMIGGEFDLSVGVAVTTSSLAASVMATQFAGNVWYGVAFALSFSILIGWLNSILLIKTRLPSFLITLSTFLMLQGLNIAVTKLVTGSVATRDVSRLPGFDSARFVFASTLIIGNVKISIVVFYWIVFVLVATWVLLRTRFGNWVYAVGGNVDSARAVGVPVIRVKTVLFIVVGFAAWFQAMHLLFSFRTVQSGAGVGNELFYIASAVVGGCLLTGGYGSAAGSALGAFIFGMTMEGVIYANWDPDWFKYFVGAMLLVATVVNTWIRARLT